MIIRRLFISAAIGLLSLSLTTAGWSQPAPAEGPVVKIRQGQVRGATTDDVSTFLGIPFAVPPVGALRWRPPQPAARWSGVREATRPGAQCALSEDCLFINVTKPADAKPGDRLAVMVWIYGGAFIGGSGVSGFGVNHDGTQFAKKGVILVTFNYRVGRAGWFAHPALTKEGPTGNYGLMDQIAALRWVQENITAFGGNPRNVTIFGESAGGISVGYLMLAQEARGLFHKAIAESSFARNTPSRLEVAEAYAVRAATVAGVVGSDAQAAAALRRLPLTAFPASGGTNDEARPFPILDGRLIRSGPAEGFAQGRQARVPLLIGGNSNEASYFRPQAAQLAAITDRREALFAAFNPDRNLSDVQVINDLVTAQQVTEGDRHLARLHARTGQPTYLYYFSYLPPAQRATSAGAAHLAEVPYVFGSLRNPAPSDMATSQAMNSAWAAFAKYGLPGSTAGPEWPRFDAAREASLEFANDGQHVREHHLKARLDYVEQGRP